MKSSSVSSDVQESAREANLIQKTGHWVDISTETEGEIPEGKLENGEKKTHGINIGSG